MSCVGGINFLSVHGERVIYRCLQTDKKVENDAFIKSEGGREGRGIAWTSVLYCA